MKRFISALLALILCLCVSGYSIADDEFTLRNGIKFGDTMDDILVKETTLERTSETSNEFKGKIAGYNNASCVFGFADEKLISMNYGFSQSCTSRDTTNDIYKNLYQSLNRQYGKPLGNTGGTVHLITGPAMTGMGLIVYLFGSLEKYTADILDYDEWIVYLDDYCVKIDLTSYYYRDSSYQYNYYVNLSYLKFTDEDVSEALQHKQEQQDEVDNDL